MNAAATEKEKQMAERCLTCPACLHARKKQRGITYWFVENIETGNCPYCAACYRITGKAHEA